MVLLILLIFIDFLEVQPQSLPQAKLTIFPTFATDEEEVQMVCGGHENQHMSECMFYPDGQETDRTQPSSSCNISITGAKLIAWSQNQKSSYVNISCYYTVHGVKETSPHSDIVSVRVRGLATMSTSPPITEGSPTTMIPNGTIQDTSNQSTHESHSLTDPANASLESTTLANNTEHASVFSVITKGPEIKEKKIKNFFFFAVVASGGGIVLTGLLGSCLYGCTQKSKAER
ncbi:hypothetical protein QQF64_004032 [Cirrhinus molitorella]|uniref:Uncharacterized protein n=1 Tax=Cirrhinus molitorella TaxID=172907 RepID=A0ABR3MN41_9TELE